MNAVPIDAMNATAPVIQVIARLPRHDAIQNFPQRWTTIKAMNSSTLHRCVLLTKWPTSEPCHHAGLPRRARRPSQHDDERSDRGDTEDVDPGGDVDRLLVGEQLIGGKLASARRRTQPVQLRGDCSGTGAGVGARSALTCAASHAGRAAAMPR